jgi:type I restriction enzyme S subunit
MRQQRGVRQKNLNLSMIRNLEVPVPPIELQQKFAQIVEKVETMRKIHNQSNQEINKLFNTFAQKAFKGELTA